MSMNTSSRTIQNWNLSCCIQQICQIDYNVSTTPSFKTPATLENLQEALIICAKLVEKYGDDYIIYFDRISHEISQYNEKAKKSELISKLARKNLLSK